MKQPSENGAHAAPERWFADHKYSVVSPPSKTCKAAAKNLPTSTVCTDFRESMLLHCVTVCMHVAFCTPMHFISQTAGHKHDKLGHIKELISVFLQPVTGYDADEMARHKFRNLRKLHPLQQQLKDLDLIDDMVWYEAQIAVDGDRTRPTLSALYLKNLEGMVCSLIPFTYVHMHKIRAVMQICLWSSS